MLSYMVGHDPLAVLGFSLLGTSSILFFHIQLKMRSIGYKIYPLFVQPYKLWEIPAKYLKICAKHRWSAWPVYLLWPSLILGIATLIVGLFRLQD